MQLPINSPFSRLSADDKKLWIILASHSTINVHLVHTQKDDTFHIKEKFSFIVVFCLSTPKENEVNRFCLIATRRQIHLHVPPIKWDNISIPRN